MSLKTNYIYNTLYQVLVVLLPLITTPYVSRILGVEGVGKYAYTSSYTQYFILLGMLGISLYGKREIGYVSNDKFERSKRFCNIYAVQFICAVIAYFLYIFLFVGINNADRTLYLIQSLLILGCLFDISWFFIGIENLKSVVIRNLIVKLISIIAIFMFVKENNDILIYALIMGLGTVFGQLIMWLNLRDKVVFVKPSLPELKTHFIFASKLLVSQLAIQIYVVLDKTMLGILATEVQVGLYDNSQKIIKTILGLVTSIAVVLMPRMSSLFAQDKMDEFKSLANTVFSYINFIGIPIMVGLIAVAKEFSAWFYGPDFQGIEYLLMIGSVIIIAISWSNVLGMQIMIPMKKEKQFTVSVTIGAVVNFMLNLMLIKSFGAIGSTLSTVIAEITVTIVQVYFLRELIDFKYALRTFAKPILCAIPMYIIVKQTLVFMPINIIGTTVAVCVGIMVYFSLAYLLKHELMIKGIEELKDKVMKRRHIDEKI